MRRVWRAGESTIAARSGWLRRRSWTTWHSNPGIPAQAVVEGGGGDVPAVVVDEGVALAGEDPHAVAVPAARGLDDDLARAGREHRGEVLAGREHPVRRRPPARGAVDDRDEPGHRQARGLAEAVEERLLAGEGRERLRVHALLGEEHRVPAGVSAELGLVDAGVQEALAQGLVVAEALAAAQVAGAAGDLDEAHSVGRGGGPARVGEGHDLVEHVRGERHTGILRLAPRGAPRGPGPQGALERSAESDCACLGGRGPRGPGCRGSGP